MDIPPPSGMPPPPTYNMYAHSEEEKRRERRASANGGATCHVGTLSRVVTGKHGQACLRERPLGGVLTFPKKNHPTERLAVLPGNPTRWYKTVAG
ncbi:hypothetical protein M422DRAFT_270912 [Sphaerobolus stellatus SS14]|uniref:Uncharacterized protein n=1 Tax=Sphaerobolus stellatus (strain SS14) TaxID=990650 RepID=A0A0C9UR42_SPHS4|nr:hypothetical protein M422DRAFT_270912 [Sphaerobolus stellatus SS14]